MDWKEWGRQETQTFKLTFSLFAAEFAGIYATEMNETAFGGMRAKKGMFRTVSQMHKVGSWLWLIGQDSRWRILTSMIHDSYLLVMTLIKKSWLFCWLMILIEKSCLFSEMDWLLLKIAWIIYKSRFLEKSHNFHWVSHESNW